MNLILYGKCILRPMLFMQALLMTVSTCSFEGCKNLSLYLSSHRETTYSCYDLENYVAENYDIEISDVTIDEDEKDEVDEGNYEDVKDEDVKDDDEIDNDTNTSYDLLYDTIGIDEFLSTLDTYDVMDQYDISMKEVYIKLVSGDVNGLIEDAKLKIKKMLVDCVTSNHKIIINLMIVLILGSCYMVLAKEFHIDIAIDTGFYVTYLMMATLLLSSFLIIYNIGMQTMDTMMLFMKAFVPTFMLTIASVSGVTSGSALYEGTLLAIYGIDEVLKKIVFPGIKIYVIFALINPLLSGNGFSGILSMMKKLLKRVLLVATAIISGFQLLEAMVVPSADQAIYGTVARSAKVLPGGQAISALSGVAVSAGILLKNSIGAVGMVMVLLIMLVPFIQVAICVIEFSFAKGAVELVSDKRLSSSLNAVADGGELLLIAMLCITVLFLLCIAIAASATNWKGYYG